MLGRLVNLNSPFLNQLGLLVLRLMVAGAMFFNHGLMKIQNYSTMSGAFPDPIGLGSSTSLFLATFAEGFCTVLIMLGALTRLAAIPLVLNMAVIFFFVHGSDGWDVKEFPFLYLAGFIGVFALGGGKFSVDRLLFKNK